VNLPEELIPKFTDAIMILITEIAAMITADNYFMPDAQYCQKIVVVLT